MKIYLFDQQKHFREHLEYFKSRPVMAYDKAKLPQKVMAIDINTPKTLSEIDLGFLFNYRIFPERIMHYKAQWEDEGRQMQVGDTIVQQAYLPPFRGFSQKLVFAVRISEIINEPDRRGFSYETIVGHAEKGISTFTLEQQAGKLIFKIQTCSATGNILSALVAPILSIPYQAYCTRQALEYVKRQINES